MVDWVDIVNGSLEARVTRRSFERVWKREGWELKGERPPQKSAPKAAKPGTTDKTEAPEPGDQGE